jgi:hypothetical protein
MLEDGDNLEAMRAAAAEALCDIALDDLEMQDAILSFGGAPPLLHLCRSESMTTQELAARCLWYLARSVDNQPILVQCGVIAEWVELLRNGTVEAKDVSAAGLADLGHGGEVELNNNRRRFAMREELDELPPEDRLERVELLLRQMVRRLQHRKLSLGFSAWSGWWRATVNASFNPVSKEEGEAQKPVSSEGEAQGFAAVAAALAGRATTSHAILTTRSRQASKEIAKVLGAWYQADSGDVWATGSEQKKRQGRGHTHD